VLNRSLFNRGCILMNVLKALASIVSVCNLHVIFLSKIFYAIYKWNIPSIQRKKKLRLSNSMRKADCSSLLFIEFYIPAFTPDCH
jgi:hypothetical protein